MKKTSAFFIQKRDFFTLVRHLASNYAVDVVVHVGIAVAHYILHFSSTYEILKNVNSLHCLELSKFICLKMS